ncbi:hypothetical protein [Lujinxingia sediminis]|nr:hypothetical protein [Lujinxingia sediminis]
MKTLKLPALHLTVGQGPKAGGQPVAQRPLLPLPNTERETDIGHS